MLPNLKTFKRVYKCLTQSKINITTQASAFVKDGKQKKSFTVCVEGNIASGKTTFLEFFKRNQNVETFEEPLEKWTDIYGYNALENFYRDPQKWSMTLETYIQLTMLEIHRKKTKKPVKLMERSIYSAKYCFMENLKKNGALHDLDYVVLTDWFNWIVNNYDCHVDLIVYLQAKPETVYKRLKIRNRREEQGIQLDYLKRMHDLHEEWLNGRSIFALPSQVLVIPADKSIEEMYKIYNSREKEIFCGIL